MDASNASTVGEPAARLILSWRGRESCVAACSRLDEPSGFSIGTQADNDLPLHSTYSSRNHAELCWRHNGFTLTDHIAIELRNDLPRSKGSFFIHGLIHDLVSIGSVSTLIESFV